MARASGKRLVIDEVALDRTLAPELREVAEFLRVTALDLALTGGEDYVLLATDPAQRRPTFAHRISKVEDGAGVLLERLDGGRIPLSGGFDHFTR